MKRGIIDLSSVIWTCLLGGKDAEHGQKVISEAGKEVLVNSAGFGFEHALNHILKFMETVGLTPHQLIFVMEGKNSKQDRQTICPTYKAGRDKVPEQYEQFNACKQMVLDAFLELGSNMCWQDGGVEADDVIGYLAINLDGEVWIDSGDKDLAVLVNPEAGIHHYRSGVIDQNPFGDFPHQFIPVYIALVGDSSDRIPGAKGFGDTAWNYLYYAYGNDGLELMEGLIKGKELLRLEEDVAQQLLLPKKGIAKELQTIIDNADGVYMSYELGRLRTERVNTLRRPLEWRAGMVKPRHDDMPRELRKWAGTKRIVSAEAYAEAMEWAKKQIEVSPYVSLDIETATPPDSDEWLEQAGKEEKVDVFGSALTSLQLTFGPNLQYTFYLPYDNVQEEGCTNLTVKQIAAFVDLVPRHKKTYIQNVAFELPICYMSWGEMWASDPEYHGFLRNVRDTAIMSSYVDENRPKGLKDNSKLLLGYDQVSYQAVTTRDELRSEWDGVGTIMSTYLEPILKDTGEMEEVVTGQMIEVEMPDMSIQVVPEKKIVPKLVHDSDIEHVVVQRKMNQLTAREVLNYGADDTICTAALANFYRIIMEIEDTFDCFEEVETFPAYLTALAFVQGTDFSLERMAEMERDDDIAYDAAWPILRDYLMKIGFEGTRFEPLTALDAAGIKRACFEITGQELKTQVRTPAKLARLIEELDPEAVLPHLIEQNDLVGINEMMERNFDGEPKLDLASPPQMKRLLYGFLNIPVRVINDVTPIERSKMPKLDQAVKKFKAVRAGKSGVTMTDDEMELLKKKAKADDTAIEMALKFDTKVVNDEARAALKALGVMKKVMTRRSLFYSNYKHVKHWKDNKVHASTNQCAATTRRYSMSMPNLQQLPKKGEAVRFRGCFLPHKKNAVICSIDYVGQELRLAAEVSQDANLLACYVGDNLKDVHSLTAAGALKLKWGAELVNGLFDKYGPDLKRDNPGTYELFMRLRKLGKADEIGKKADDHRKEAKNVNFAAQNGARAVKVSEMEIMSVPDAQIFLDGRSAMFPDVDKAAARSSEMAQRTGYAKTLMGARRHLREAMMSEERGAADRAGRQAWSTDIQGSAGEMTKMGMGRLWKSGIYFRYDARFIAPIHDELVSSVIDEHAVDFIREKHACMAQPYATMKVPVLGSISIGPDFADQHECGDWFIEESIRKELNDIFARKEAA